MKMKRSEKKTVDSSERIKNANYDKQIQMFVMLSALTCLFFYLMFPIIDGVVICKDSPSYMTMDFSREPFYPMFLLLIRMIFGAERYTFPVVLLQSVLAAYAS